ncbi:MAG: 4Fe-4S binding protein [Desulfobacterales bacterium]|uniref:4Fe-4S binding protein n=1 Tax=Candidatus Desulfatibia vada TaxID=2841696 RepID=A0A8J6NR20_9BACT|nr:4Fe-4S binding protein [Candidatus Desulfatibia vada]MBL6971499.1 4Fe-4S binding protein [Desulfobacterales bacterium]
MFEMTATILRNFFSKPATRRYPRVKRLPFEAVRGELYNQIEDCTFCTVCAVKCPSQCITVDKKAAVWAYDPFACVYCGICVDDCPVNCLSQKRDYRPPNSERQFIKLKGQLKKKIKK